jgi:hypothetical protein
LTDRADRLRIRETVIDLNCQVTSLSSGILLLYPEEYALSFGSLRKAKEVYGGFIISGGIFMGSQPKDTQYPSVPRSIAIVLD